MDAAVKEATARAKPKPSAQRSFTSPESRMTKTNHGFDYAYNAEAAVDEKSQVILAAEASAINQLMAMIDKTEENLAAAGIEDTPDTYLADAWDCSEDNLVAASRRAVSEGTTRTDPKERHPPGAPGDDY